MKKVATVVMGLILGLSITAQAQWNDSISFHSTGYVLIPGTNFVATQNLVTNTAYACFVVGNLTSLTEAQASTHTNAGGSWKQFMYSFVKSAYDDFNALASTNKSTKMILSETIQGGSGANVTINHGLQSIKSIDGGTVVAE